MVERDIERRLRAVVSDGINRLNAQQGGRYLAAISRRVHVQRSTVSRWARGEATPNPEHCDILSDAWPEYFNRDELAALQYSSMQPGAASEMLTVGVEVHLKPEEVHAAGYRALMQEPVASENQVIRLTTMHLDRNTIDPFRGAPLFDEAVVEVVKAFQGAMIMRAEQGWTIQVVLSAGSVARARGFDDMVNRLDGPNVEIYAYPNLLPLTMAPVVIANRDVMISYDHRRWERPGAAVLLRSRAVVAWANQYFESLVADAPYRLRSPVGVEHAQFERLCSDIDGTVSRRLKAGLSR